MSKCVTGNSMVAWGSGIKEGSPRDMRKISGVMGIFSLDLVMVSWVYTYVKTSNLKTYTLNMCISVVHQSHIPQ